MLGTGHQSLLTTPALSVKLLLGQLGLGLDRAISGLVVLFIFHEEVA